MVFACTAALALTGTASADTPESCKTVRFGYVGWTDIAATTAIPLPRFAAIWGSELSQSDGQAFTL